MVAVHNVGNLLRCELISMLQDYCLECTEKDRTSICCLRIGEDGISDRLSAHIFVLLKLLDELELVLFEQVVEIQNDWLVLACVVKSIDLCGQVSLRKTLTVLNEVNR